VVGFLIAPSAHQAAKSSSPVPLSQTASAGPLSVHFPAGWIQSGRIPSQAATLKLTRAVALAPVPASAGALVLGAASPVDANLLPTGFATTLSTALQGNPVKLGSFDFQRYLDLIPDGAATPISVYSAPTATGAAIIACVLPQTGAAAFAVMCERIVSSLKSATPILPLTANPTYAAALGKIIANLNRARAGGSRQLAQAKTPRAQATAAAAVATTYRQAATAAAKLHPGPIGATAAAAVVTALRGLANEYASLSTAAAHNNKHAYATAVTAISASESELSGAFSQLQKDGYTIS
jgi:hypothetical protein